MPITYQIDHARGVILTRCVGDTLYADVVAHFRELASDPDVPERLNVMLDLSEQTNAPERDQLRGVAAEVADLRKHIVWGALAIVAPTDLLFGMSRVFGIFAESYFAHTGVFRTRADAERWMDTRISASRLRDA